MKGEVMPEIVNPTFGSSRFNCPHCHTLAHQTWYSVFTNRLQKPPELLDFDNLRIILKNKDEEHIPENVIVWLTKVVEEKPFLLKDKSSYGDFELHLFNVSQCYSCEDFAIWRLGRMVSPTFVLEVEPNPDMPGDAAADFREAAEIFPASPRGAAALLRLALHRILKHLGQPGENINRDIGALVAAGLPLIVQQALDVVRVIGNNAVHPGQIDINDNRDVALKLFSLINIVVEQMITQPKQISEMFGQLPESSLNAIEKRDAKTRILPPDQVGLD